MIVLLRTEHVEKRLDSHLDFSEKNFELGSLFDFFLRKFFDAVSPVSPICFTWLLCIFSSFLESLERNLTGNR